MSLNRTKTSNWEHVVISEYLKKLQFYGKLSFTIDEIVSELSMPKANVYKALSLLKRKNELVSPVKGLYVIVPAKDLVSIVMAYLNAEYYVGLLSAALFHGATHQKAAVFQVISSRRFKKGISCGQVSISFMYKKSIKELPTQSFAVNTGNLIVSSSELTAMDLFLYPRKAGGINHIATVLSELVEVLDPTKLIVLAESSKEKAWLQRLGYILDSVDSYDPDHQQKVVKALAKYISTEQLDYRALSPNLPTKGCSRYDKWKIVENISVESDI